MVTYEERKKAVDRAMQIERDVEARFGKPDKWFQKLPLWEKVDIWVHRLFNTYIRPLWYKMNRISQRQAKGYADAEVYAFYNYHAEWVLPRLIALRDNFHGMPMKENGKVDENGAPEAYTPEEWKEILNKMCRAFWLITKKDDDFVMDCDPLTYELIEEGLALFAEHYLSLWD